MSAKRKLNSNQAVKKVFDDLDAYRDFCRDFGYKFNEADLYNMRTYPFQQFNKFRNGKNCKDQWQFDLDKFHSKPEPRSNHRGKRNK